MPVPEGSETIDSVRCDVRGSGDIMFCSAPVIVGGEYHLNLRAMPSYGNQPSLGTDLFYRCLELQHNLKPLDTIPLDIEIPVLMNIRDSRNVLSMMVYKGESNNDFLEVPKVIYELLNNPTPVVSLPFKEQILKMFGIKPLKES